MIPKGAVKDLSGNINNNEIRVSFTTGGIDYYKTHPEDDNYTLVSEEDIYKPNEGVNPETLEKTDLDGVTFLEDDSDSGKVILNENSTAEGNLEEYFDKENLDEENRQNSNLDKESADTKDSKNKSEGQVLVADAKKGHEVNAKVDEQNKILAGAKESKYLTITILICLIIFFVYKIIQRVNR